MDEENPHPWDAFLQARRNAIIWMREEMNKTDKEIATCLNMDEMQVYLIRCIPFMKHPK